MSIAVDFFPHVLHETSSKDKYNRDTVYEIIGGFGKESSKLSGRGILIFFGMRSSRHQIGLGAWGVLAIKNTPGYSHILERYNYDLSLIPNISNFEFILYLSEDIRENDNKLFKTFTIAHELQHIIQYIESMDLYAIHLLIRRYFALNNGLDNQKYRDLPFEIDSRRKAKIICYEIFEEQECNSFIETEIKRGDDIGDENYKSYWEDIKTLDLDFDYKIETELLWNEHENAIAEKIDRIRSKKDHFVSEKEKDLLEAYNLFKSDEDPNPHSAK